MLRKMRFERMAPSLLYRTLRKGVIRFLTAPHRDRRILAECRISLEAERDGAANPQRKENFAYELRALDAFERSLNALDLAGLTLIPVKHAAYMPVEGVRISLQPTAYVRAARPRGGYLAGALILDIAKGDDAKTDKTKLRIEDGRQHAAAILHQHVSSLVYDDGTKPSSDHSIIFHTFSQEKTICPRSTGRMIRNIEAACRDIASKWDRIVPPAKFDPSRATKRTWH